MEVTELKNLPNEHMFVIRRAKYCLLDSLSSLPIKTLPSLTNFPDASHWGVVLNDSIIVFASYFNQEWSIHFQEFEHSSSIELDSVMDVSKFNITTQQFCTNWARPNIIKNSYELVTSIYNLFVIPNLVELQKFVWDGNAIEVYMDWKFTFYLNFLINWFLMSFVDPRLKKPIDLSRVIIFFITKFLNSNITIYF